MISAKRSAQRARSAGVAREQVADAQLEVLEVDAGALGLGRLVRGGEARQQVVEQRERGPGVIVGAGGPVGRPGRAVGAAVVVLERLGAGRQLRALERGRAAARPAPRRAARTPPSASSACGHAGAAAARRAARRRPRRQPRRAAPGRAARRGAGPAAAVRRAAAAQRGVGGRRSAAPGPSRRRRRRRAAGRAARGHPGLERVVERASRPGAAPRASSSTVKRGSSPAASGWARSTRAQKPWMVPIQAASTARACSSSPASANRRRMRSRSSAAAFSVNVSVRIAPTARRRRADGLGEPLDHHRGLARPGARGQERATRSRSAIAARCSGVKRLMPASSTLGSPARQIAG